jgi:hypothetical protein
MIFWEIDVFFLCQWKSMSINWTDDHTSWKCIQTEVQSWTKREYKINISCHQVFISCCRWLLSCARCAKTKVSRLSFLRVLGRLVLLRLSNVHKQDGAVQERVVQQWTTEFLPIDRNMAVPFDLSIHTRGIALQICTPGILGFSQHGWLLEKFCAS